MALGVRRLGFVADADLPALLSLAGAVAYPSLLEGFGLPVVEVLACGAPTVTADRGATAEVAGSFSGAALRRLEDALGQGPMAPLQMACAADLAALRGALRGLLHYHLGSAHLRTREVMQGLHRLLDTSPTPAR